MSEIKKEYLGDSVYADFMGGNLILTTENGMPDDPSNTIYLEGQVIVALQQYLKRVEETLSGST